MKYLVDANISSEPTRPSPDPRVLDWLPEHEPDMAVDPVVVGELRFGILILPKGKKRAALEHWFDHGVRCLHCLPWDRDTGLKWAELLSRLRQFGKAMPIKDRLIAATGLSMVWRLPHEIAWLSQRPACTSSILLSKAPITDTGRSSFT